MNTKYIANKILACTGILILLSILESIRIYTGLEEAPGSNLIVIFIGAWTLMEVLIIWGPIIQRYKEKKKTEKNK